QAPFELSLLEPLLRDYSGGPFHYLKGLTRFPASGQPQELRKLPRARIWISIPEIVPEKRNRNRPAGNDFQLHGRVRAQSGETFEITFPVHVPRTHCRPLQQGSLFGFPNC